MTHDTEQTISTVDQPGTSVELYTGGASFDTRGLHIVTISSRDDWSVECFDSYHDDTTAAVDIKPCAVMDVYEPLLHDTADVPADQVYVHDGHRVVNVVGDGTTSFGSEMIPMTPREHVCGLAVNMSIPEASSWIDDVLDQCGPGVYAVYVTVDTVTGVIVPRLVSPVK